MPALAIDAGTQAYARLKSEIAAAGLLRRSYGFYALLIAFAFAGYAASVAAILVLDNFVALAVACLGFTFFSLQAAFLMHDSGHRAVFSSTRNNDILGYACGGLLGMIFDNWKVRHNAHHAHPNQEDMDPDMEIPFIATSEEYYWKKSPFQRWLVKYQAFYYFPLGSIVSFSNRLGTITYFLNNRTAGEMWKLAIYVCGFALLFVSPFVLFSIEKALFVFVLVHVSTGIYLANCFAPNHKGMPQVENGVPISFLEQQVITARNVSGGGMTDFLLGGLNHQVEHHLFPNTPRNKLRFLRPHVRRVCEEMGIAYTDVSLIETNRVLLRELAAVSHAARVAAPIREPALVE